MTVHPINTEALRARLAPLAWHSTPPITTDHARRVLDALDAAEHRATRAEAERDEWRQTALDERGAALDALEQVKVRDARIKAVQDVHEESAAINNAGWTTCLHCTEQTKRYVLYPCPTIRALDN